ncbi:coiled-coil domain-containing protein 170-like [Ochotona princeps]|uniref:coiled-coil domain-containing protein 170-like n=1 Tax=Ochotona princeps TaxID=9978 RepID=UPI0027152B4F|nr:coiled-coil domain-containing protein 170-like [Ochotona princeps]
MSSPFQFLSHSDPGRLATEPHEAKPSEVRNPSAHSSQKNSPEAIEMGPPRNPNTYNKKATNQVCSASLLVKYKNLSAELRNLQNKLFLKETSLQEMKSELKSYRENNVQQSFQILSLQDDIKDLQELIASLTRIKSLKNTNIQSLERGNWDLTKRIIGLENCLRIHLVERETAEQKAHLLEKRLSEASRFTPFTNVKVQEDSLGTFTGKDKGEVNLAKNFERNNIFHAEGPKDGQKIWEKCQQDLIHKEKQIPELDRPPHSCDGETKTEQSQYHSLLGQLATLLSDSVGPIPATEDAVKERIQEMGASEQSWKSKTKSLQQEIQLLTQRLEELYGLNEEAVQGSTPNEENSWEQKRPFKCLEGKIAINDFFQRKSDLDWKKENPVGKNSQRNEHDMKFKQLGKDNMQQMLLTLRQNLQIATTQRMEEKIQKLQKQLSDLKLSNKNMKTQLTRVNILKDKTIERLRQSLTKVETGKEKVIRKTENSKTAFDSGEQEADKEKARCHVDNVTPEPSTAKSTLEPALGRERELVDFRETIMKMLGFNMKTANKEIINQLKLIIQVYEISNKTKIAPGYEKGQEND